MRILRTNFLLWLKDKRLCNISRLIYEADFYAWMQEQVKLMESQAWDQLDRWHLIEEIAALGKQQRQELRDRLAILTGHWLKWQYQNNKFSRSWLASIRVQRRNIQPPKF
ncbi:DUF29 domain-containing protein [Limnothrix sp. FACHB-1088]|uniref:DUF29 domain-containing protein n=1 Tax=unclassified Limnothrix TaxID=2632864 RepID=UPI00322067FE